MKNATFEPGLKQLIRSKVNENKRNNERKEKKKKDNKGIKYFNKISVVYNTSIKLE